MQVTETQLKLARLKGGLIGLFSGLVERPSPPEPDSNAIRVCFSFSFLCLLLVGVICKLAYFMKLELQFLTALNWHVFDLVI